MGLDQVDYLSYLEVLGERGLLRGDTDQSPGTRFCRVPTEKPGCSLVGSALAEEKIHRGGLAGPVGSEQGDQLTPFHLEIHVLERLHGSVSFRHVDQFCDGHDASCSHPAGRIIKPAVQPLPAPVERTEKQPETGDDGDSRPHIPR